MTEVALQHAEEVAAEGAATPFDLVWGTFKFPDRIEPFSEQIRVINRLAALPNQGEWLDMGCVDADTEYLSPEGWKRIGDYSGGQVAQWVPPTGGTLGTLEWTEPTRFIKKHCDELVVFRTTRGVDQKLSVDHRVLYVTAGGSLKEATAEEVLERHEKNKMGWKGRFITTFQGPHGPGMDISDADLRLTVAVAADGHFPNSGSRCIVRLKKRRKIERLRGLLATCSLDFSETEEPWAGCEGFVRFVFYAPHRVKVFGPEFYACNDHQLRIVADEVRYWDSHFEPAEGRGWRFSSNEKASADFVQYALSASGVRCTLYTSEREGRNIEYGVQTFTRSPLAYLCGCDPVDGGGFTKTKTAWKEINDHGFVYCFTVPSSYLILRRNGNVFVTGNCGKTFCSTVVGLYWRMTRGMPILVIMPPVLLPQWASWLRSIRPELKVVHYAGTPAQRKAMDLSGDFVIVGIQIFKKDFDRFLGHYAGREVFVIVDEATMVANIDSDSHKKVYEFTAGRPRTLLSGTPANKPGDAYGLIKFTAPGTYRNRKQFDNLHVEEVDFWGQPKKWVNLDTLYQNLLINSERLLFEDLYKDVETPLFIPVEYDLSPEHLKLYRKLSEEELLKLPDGGKIDATTENKLRHALGQIIVNFDHFSGDPSKRSVALDIVQQKLDELGDDKLIVFCDYRMTVRQLVREFGAVAINSEVSATQKEANKQRFIQDPSCRLIAIQFISGGKGLDGLQEVCNTELFLEPCQQPRDFHQAVGRVKRLGQKRRPRIYMAQAKGTLQVRGWRNLLTNDDLVNKVSRNAYELRQLLFGE